jgi:hypothetical protein
MTTFNAGDQMAEYERLDTPAPEGAAVATVGLHCYLLWTDAGVRANLPTGTPLYASPVVPVGVSREDEAWSLAMGIPAFNDLPAQFQQDIHAAILAALGTTDQGSRSKVPTDGGQAAVGDGWIEWSGGENPVPGKMVCVRWDGGEDIKAWPSEKIAWGVDSNGSSYVISYRLAAPASPIPGGYEPKASVPTEGGQAAVLDVKEPG